MVFNIKINKMLTFVIKLYHKRKKNRNIFKGNNLIEVVKMIKHCIVKCRFNKNGICKNKAVLNFGRNLNSCPFETTAVDIRS